MPPMLGIASISPSAIDSLPYVLAPIRVNAPLSDPTSKIGDRIPRPPRYHVLSTTHLMLRGTSTTYPYQWIPVREPEPTDEDRLKAMWPRRAHPQTCPKSNVSTATKRVTFRGIARSPVARGLPEPSLLIYSRKLTERP